MNDADVRLLYRVEYFKDWEVNRKAGLTPSVANMRTMLNLPDAKNGFLETIKNLFR
jgi:hypothetical protein